MSTIIVRVSSQLMLRSGGIRMGVIVCLQKVGMNRVLRGIGLLRFGSPPGVQQSVQSALFMMLISEVKEFL